MKPLLLDFVAAPPRLPLAWVCLLVGALMLVVSADRHAELEDEVTQAELQLKRMQRQHTLLLGQQGRASKDAKQGKDGKLQGPQREQALLDAVARSDWRAPLLAVEAALDKDVAMLGLNQEGSARRLRIVAEARNIDAALAFVERLRDSRRFSEVMLSGHDHHVSTGMEVLGFTVLTAW